MKKSHVILILLFVPLWLCAQSEKVDLGIVYMIKQEGLKNSSIEELAFGLTDFVGPRLTGSSGNARGNEWARKKMEEIGLQNVRIEPAGEFGSGGWDNIRTYAAMTSPYYSNFACNPVAWTGSTKGKIKTDVVYLDVTKEEDLAKYKGKLAGKIVMMPSRTEYALSFEPLANRYTDAQLDEMTHQEISSGRRRTGDFSSYMAERVIRNKIDELIKNENVAAVVINGGQFNIPRSGQASYTSGQPEPVCQLYIPVEAYGRMQRLLSHNVPVEMEIDVENRFFESKTVYNVIGEIPGTDKLLKNQVVLLGAHIDSWHGGTGAADNASGCVVMLEAMRILKSLGVSPKRTIRIALWGGEEQGYYGSSGYIEKYLVNPGTSEHKPDYANFAGYFNMDNGSGRYRGIYLQENELVRPVFEEWLKPFEDMDATTVSIRNTSGTDHIPFNRAGLPGFQFIQDDLDYYRGYHTVTDTYERLVMSDLKQNAVITASFAYNAAMRAEKLPSKPEMKSTKVPSGR